MSQTIAVTEEWPKKFRVKCDTCRVSQSYYTEVGVRYFNSKHSGHTVSGSPKISEISEEPSPGVQSISGKNDFQVKEVANETLPSIEDLSQETKVPKLESKKQIIPKIQVEPKHVEPKLSISAPKPQESKVSVSKSPNAKGEQAPLLLSKFSFVKEGEIYQREAVRISGVLRSFRWKVEPPYVIGALFDDNLSIQSNTGVMSREVIMGIEQAGYSFVAAESPKGVMTAWFKKGSDE